MEILKRFAAKLAFAIANGVIRILYPPKVTWEDKKGNERCVEKKATVLFYSNHTSHVDGFYMTRLFGKYRVHTFVARDWYDKKKINWLFRNLPYIPMNRQEMDTSWLSMGLEKMNEAARSTYSRKDNTSHTGVMDEFKPGFLMLRDRHRRRLYQL